MPFASWKYKGKKSNNLSRFFRDHIQSHRRRGGPLVVETGFPTSIVDLIVKNRQRLRRSSEIEIPCDSSSISECSQPSPLQPPASPPPVLNRTVEERDDTCSQEVKDGENYKGVLMSVLSVSFVVVLALGTKKFALGLTMSAFSLIFADYFGKHLLGLLIPCSESKKELRLVVVKVLRFMTVREETKLEELGSRFKEIIKSESSDSMNNSLNNINSIDEIRILQSVVSDEVAECKEKGTDNSDSDGNLKLRKSDSLAAFLEEEDDYTCEILEIKEKKSRRAKIKSKFKHIFARKSRREQKEEILAEEIDEADEVVGGDERKLECGSNLSSMFSGSNEAEEATTLNCGGSDKALTEEVGVEESQKQKQGSCGYLFVCIIILIGLSGGRISALLLILTCCLVKKSGGKLGRCWILPLISHFCPGV